jgi:hypothetical protein
MSDDENAWWRHWLTCPNCRKFSTSAGVCSEGLVATGQRGRQGEGATVSELRSTADGILANDTILPSQFYAKPSGPYAPERMLWISVLEDAIRCIQVCPPQFRGSCYDDRNTLGIGNRKRKYGLDAATWLDSDEMYPGSYLWLCEVLDVDPGWLRGRIADGVTLKRRSPVSRDANNRIVAARPRVRHRQIA